jgi:membrane protein
VDAEVERGRELQAGIAAEEQVQLPPRDTRVSEKKAAKREEDVAAGARLRETAGRDASPDDRKRDRGRRR